MRNFNQTLIDLDSSIVENLNILVDLNTNSDNYKKAFLNLGSSFGEIINKEIDQDAKVMICCTNEDADWLTKGLIETLKVSNPKLSVFWNITYTPNNNTDFRVAPIIKTYIEEIENPDLLIIVKSIIYTSCVVRTNLEYLIDKINPKEIKIFSPVIYKDSAEILKKQFSPNISTKFDFTYFAVDDVIQDNNVIPGIGGNVYQRLGFGDNFDKNKYIPNLVKERRNS